MSILILTFFVIKQSYGHQSGQSIFLSRLQDGLANGQALLIENFCYKQSNNHIRAFSFCKGIYFQSIIILYQPLIYVIGQSYSQQSVQSIFQPRLQDSWTNGKALIIEYQQRILILPKSHFYFINQSYSQQSNCNNVLL